MNKEYKYLIAYVFSKKGYVSPGVGTAQISRMKKIESFEDINKIVDDICTRNDFLTVSIINIMPIGHDLE